MAKAVKKADTRLTMYCYNNATQGGTALARQLGILKLAKEGSKYRGNPAKTIINWGSSHFLPENFGGSRVLNKPEAVQVATNKLSAFAAMSGKLSVPPFTTDIKVAKSWINKGSVVVARTVLNGYGGEGIVIVTDEDDMPQAPLYTKYIPKKDEYRVHVVNGKSVAVQRKALRHGFQGEPNFKVRNFENGFVFAREGFVAPKEVVDNAIAAVKALSLDFGAVDVVWNEKTNKAYVLEVNTAPGLEGQTVLDYANAIKEMMNAAG